MVPLTVNVATDVHTAINRLEDASLVIPRCITDLKNEVEEALAAEAAKKKPVQNDNQSLGKYHGSKCMSSRCCCCCCCCYYWCWWLLLLSLLLVVVVVDVVVALLLGTFGGGLIQCIY